MQRPSCQWRWSSKSHKMVKTFLDTCLLASLLNCQPKPLRCWPKGTALEKANHLQLFKKLHHFINEGKKEWFSDLLLCFFHVPQKIPDTHILQLGRVGKSSIRGSGVRQVRRRKQYTHSQQYRRQMLLFSLFPSGASRRSIWGQRAAKHVPSAAALLPVMSPN